MTTDAAAVTPPARTLDDLAGIVRSLAARPAQWMNRVQLRCGERWFECVEHGPDHDVWLISWLPGQGTGFHDHGGSSGAFAVVLGELEEHRPDTDPLTVRGGEVRAFGSQYAHDVRNASAAPAPRQRSTRCSSRPSRVCWMRKQPTMPTTTAESSTVLTTTRACTERRQKAGPCRSTGGSRSSARSPVAR